MLFMLYKVGIFLALNLPLNAGYTIACFVSMLYSAFSARDNSAIMENLRVLFPDKDKSQLEHLRNSIFVNFGKYLVDFFRFSLIGRDYIDKYVSVEGRHFLDDALSKGRGVIAASAHLGNWELGGVVLSAIGVPLDVVALTHKQEDINIFFTDQRKQKGIGVIPVGTAVRRCFKSLACNRVVALVCDRDYFDNGFMVDFFGKKTIIPKGPALFSRRHNCPIVPVFMVRNQDDTFILKILKPIEPVYTEDEHADLVLMTEKIVRVMEDVIRQYPEQWFVFRRFWEKIGRGKGQI
jgi:Kdo2-lipid IVA lauroyltransferase/acyltransferase